MLNGVSPSPREEMNLYLRTQYEVNGNDLVYKSLIPDQKNHQEFN